MSAHAAEAPSKGGATDDYRVGVLRLHFMRDWYAIIYLYHIFFEANT